MNCYNGIVYLIFINYFLEELISIKIGNIEIEVANPGWTPFEFTIVYKLLLSYCLLYFY